MPKRGDKKSFRIKYKDLDPACPVFGMRVRAYDREHAEGIFWAMDSDDDGWELISITEV